MESTRLRSAIGRTCLIFLAGMVVGCAAYWPGNAVDPSAARHLRQSIQLEFEYLVKTFDAHDSKGDVELCAPKRFAVARFAVYQAIEERRNAGMEQMTRFISRAHRILTSAVSQLQTEKCVDSDGDGLTDLAELRRYKTNPASADTDSDGLSDGAEIHRYRTDPLRSDTDGDLLDDGEEAIYRRLSPLHPDSDGDGYTDGIEVARGTDPRDQCSYPSTGPRRPGPWTKCKSPAPDKKAGRKVSQPNLPPGQETM